MKPMDDKNTPNAGRKLAWTSPRLDPIGNLREFVREGNANGKSAVAADGSTSGNNESMLK